MDLRNKAVLITGGKRIGVVVAADLARQGMDVAVVYRRSREEAEAVVKDVETAGRKGVALQADLSRAAECTDVVARAAEALGRLDVLINMASVYAAVPFDMLDEAAWDAGISVDLRAAFLCSLAAVPHMRAAGEGRIVNFSDWIAASGRPRYAGYLPYYVAKRGIMGLTEALALELAGSNILVNAVAPGPILAPEGSTTEEFAAVEAATPLGRWGGEAEIAAAVRFFLESGFVTGETVRVDGGRHIR